MIRSCRFFIVILLCTIFPGCASLPPGSDFSKTPSLALSNPGQTWLGQHFEKAGRVHKGKSGFRMIPVGADGFLIRMQMINAAERTIDLQYFVFRGDVTGRLLANAVLQAANRGVRVRILIDDVEMEADDIEQLIVLDRHPLIEARIFNPLAYRGRGCVKTKSPRLRWR